MSLHRRATEALFDDIEKNFGLYIGLLLIYTICATAGSFTVVALPDDLLTNTKSYISAAIDLLAVQAPTLFPLLARSLAMQMLSFFLISLASIRKPFMLLGAAAIAFSGLAAGFASRILIVGLDTRGALLSIACIWIAEILLFPCRLKALQLACSYIGSEDQKGIRLRFALCLTLACFAVFWQCIVAPLFVQWINF